MLFFSFILISLNILIGKEEKIWGVTQKEVMMGPTYLLIAKLLEWEGRGRQQNGKISFKISYSTLFLINYSIVIIHF